MDVKSRKTKKLNIAMLGHKRIPSREGGVEIVVEELSTRIVKQGHSVTCFNRNGNHISGKEFNESMVRSEYKGVRLKSVLSVEGKGLAALTSSFFATLKALFGGYDCIHYHAEGSCAMLWLPHLFGIRTVATIHGLDWQRVKWGKVASAYLKFGEITAVKYADEIIVLSKNVQDYFMKSYSRKTNFIHNGITKFEFMPAKTITEKWGLRKESYILFVARIVPEKGLKYLIEAFQQVNTEKKLIIAGGSSDTEGYIYEMKELAKSDSRIMFTGFVQGRVLEELYSNAYLYVLPSDVEGMPLSLLEAMSYGNCCLVSDIAECTSVVENHGVVFKKSSSADLQDKLQQLIDNYNQVKLYKSDVSDYITDKYNWDNVVQSTMRLYYTSRRKQQR